MRPEQHGLPSEVAMTCQWIIMPFIDCYFYTARAARDCMAMAGTKLLLIDNGSEENDRRRVEMLVASAELEGWSGRVLLWQHRPPLTSLCATWNRALDLCWNTGAQMALVVNNDVRLAPCTWEILADAASMTDALFVSAVGVKEAQFSLEPGPVDFSQRGGPDFSCFMVTKACHKKYRFDERLTYFGDNDYHYRLQLGGDGSRIFSVNLPYLHYGSRTINRSEAARVKAAKVFEAHRDYYLKKWGGLGGKETFREAFDGREEA